jgi:hypothetical protein
MIKRSLVLIVILCILICCKSLSLSPTATPLPGWDNPVSNLFVKISSFPKGWKIDNYKEVVDPRINQVTRIYWAPSADESQKVMQTIWRAYTTTGAEVKFAELAQEVTSRGWFPRFPSTGSGVVSEVVFGSKVAEKWGIVCRIDVIPECFYIALYRNYVTEVEFTIQFDDFMGLDTLSVEKLLSGVDEQFRDYIRLPDIIPNDPSYLLMIPTTLYNSNVGIDFESLLIKADAFPKGWEVAFKEWPNITKTASGAILGTRNFSRDECYINSPSLRKCYLTQFLAWYPNIQDTIDEWQGEYAAVNMGDPASLGVLRIPKDIVLVDSGADQSFIACVILAGGEECEAILRFGNYWIGITAQMQSLNTLMGHSQNGLTHSEFTQIIGRAAAQAKSILITVK